MNSEIQLYKFLDTPYNPPPTQPVQIQQTHVPVLTHFNAQPQVYEPMFYETYDPMKAALSEYPDLCIDAIFGSVTPGKRIQIQNEELLDHRAILQVFYNK